MNKASLKFKFKDGHSEIRNIDYNHKLLVFKTSVAYSEVEELEIYCDAFSAFASDKGFFLIPNIQQTFEENSSHAALSYFKERQDTESVFPYNVMPFYAVNHGERAILAVVYSMDLGYSLVCGVKNGKYYLYPRFRFDDGCAYENIEIRFFQLEGGDASYSGIARRYRKYQLERGACQPIKQRIKEYPVIGEAALGHEVRVRMGWKPVPPPVLEQTNESEPPMHTAIDFNRLCDILDEFHQQGIDKAEFCLVGWNKSGHDGRFPDIFPVEPELGGESGLKKLISKAREYGYLICGHTNLMDSYTIAKRWKEEYLMRNHDGSLHKGGCWGGGQSYFLCPQMAHEYYAKEDFDAMAKLGFRGIHYLDVMSILKPEACYDKNHQLTPKESGRWRGKTLALARDKIGASGSEGSWDFCIGSLDYVLYAVFSPHLELPEICDKTIPLWHLVYHGIVLYNASCETVNTAVHPDRKFWLKNIEYGGRPLAYFYAKFLSSGRNWMGEIDCGCATDEELRNCVKYIKREYNEYKTLRELQFEFMDNHNELAPGVYCIDYSNGKSVIVNYNDNPYEYAGHKVESNDFKVI